ncbi:MULTISPECIES: adenylate/guanylate cyclase domain-containing protein [unclassified Rhizobium]|uniref:adenylate/guanylate cyclase domain-containing protein n=1 Tax=unclassified Rhizobium TaxID=2613769 RepID=UPI000EA9AF72|nr:MULTISPECIES: adenylate/guanylate cyclase domain-containing protein [unclassified Rhizobium]AYG68853.1 adenylate/guanylate cyclase domain-containing protein [Rhizobium sp. CCGE531]AYG75240.1 adenylate/guanylate cyclase domain-containing protein [Rhizobium sp. CCGE532]
MQSSIEAIADSSHDDLGIWPTKQSKILDWLMNDVRDQRFIDNILVELCEKLLAAGIPVARSTMHFRTLHPQWAGARILWRTGMKEGDIATFSYGTDKTPQFLASPINEIFSGAIEVRQNLEVSDGNQFAYPLYRELHAEGLTDYIAWPIYHTLGKRHIVTFATDMPGGFTEAHITVLRDLLPALTMVTEIRLKNIMARTLLRTYVGPHASEQILAGATTRGSGATVGAAILICDLRDFTTISDMWPRDDVIELLNGYFDAMVEPIEKRGGEILKFMGDGLLAIFPLSDPNACHNLLLAVSEAQAAVAALNEENRKHGREVLRYGVGVHVGDVMYGNIGSRTRLDFTVIGPAVNIASRLESLTKEVKRPVLLSKAFVDMAACRRDMESLGSFPLKGLGEPVDVYAFAAKETPRQPS